MLRYSRLVSARGFKHGGLKRFAEKQDARALPQRYVERIRDILSALDDDPFESLAAPGYRLHPLKGSRKGQWSVRVSKNWRITFRFERGEVYDIDLEDYH